MRIDVYTAKQTYFPLLGTITKDELAGSEATCTGLLTWLRAGHGNPNKGVVHVDAMLCTPSLTPLLPQAWW